MAEREGILRQDIQVLRGYAVLLVLLYHAGIGRLAGGYLGVDIFFVISGYLITGIIARGLETRGFSFVSFYFRRARRLLPATLVVLAATTIGAHFLLERTENADFLRTLAGALTFTTNFVLERQIDYFDGFAGLKPLLHMWSLAIEEQFYLIAPTALFILPRRWWTAATVLTLAAGLLVCLLQVDRLPSDTFYHPHTRIWELQIGALLALAFDRDTAPAKAAQLLFWPAVAVLFAVPAFVPAGRLGFGHPGVDALAVCLATAVVILARSPRLENSQLVAPLAFIGDFSYSLYLVHWPLFAFAHNVFVGQQLPPTLRAALASLSLVLGFLLYRFVEIPFREQFPLPSLRLIGGLAASSLAVAAIGIGLNASRPANAGFATRNAGFGMTCTQGPAFTDLPQCRNAEAAQIVLWGDSHAMHLVQGLAATTNLGVKQATRTGCQPLAGEVPGAPVTRDCLTFNRSVIDHLGKDGAVRYVVLAGRWASVLPPGGNEAAITAMVETVSKLRRLGKRVVLVGSPPSGGFNVALCQERLLEGLLTIGVPANCAISVAQYRQGQLPVLQFLEQASTAADVPVIWLDGALCDASICSTVEDGELLYADGTHLSPAGSVLVARRLKLAEQIVSQSR